MRSCRWFGLGIGLVLLGASGSSACPVANPEGRDRVELFTVLGDICIEMLDGPGEAPDTVANFLRYVARGDYDQSFFHRSIPGLVMPGVVGFIIQGGGFTWTPEDGYQRVPQAPPILNEPGISNLRGTVAMAKLPGDPDSATSQWFINLADNPGLDLPVAGEFTVFARVVDEDMPVVDAIAALHTESGQLAVDDPLAAAFTNLPVLELLDRDPDGYGCLIVLADPPPTGEAMGIDTCTTPEERTAAFAETLAAMDPQVPERLVLIEQAVPEPGALLQLALGGLVLAGIARTRRGGSARADLR